MERTIEIAASRREYIPVGPVRATQKGTLLSKSELVAPCRYDDKAERLDSFLVRKLCSFIIVSQMLSKSLSGRLFRLDVSEIDQSI
jgi:hypothetical protein